MTTIGFVIFFGLLGGIAVGLQGPLSSLMSQKIGILESVFYIHLGGTIAALIPLLFYGGRNLPRWREVPWYALIAGVLGLGVIAAMSYMVPRVGVAPAVVLIVAGQLLVSVILDHYGLFGAALRPLDFTRALGLLLVFFGVWVTIK
ncbi:MAG: DMT family transporter [Anaerolineae bacterium]|jgi:bacterial/archaeal transporter family-2 protein|nr:DMT family transporter [Anaerolineae bacterium]MBT7075395.1 DMT family transporter [Anaerolineae bacterium]MBT7783357.1 DMT family transporter [Anaerolineae bacterium]